MCLEKIITNYKQYEKDIQHWVNLKGEYRYLAIVSFLKKNNIECSWENVTYYIKYDKRLLVNTFKYLVFLEELCKSYIFKNKSISQSDLRNHSFRATLDDYLSIGEAAKYDDINLELLEKEKESLINLRNSVVHNKILLTHKYGGNSLMDILNLIIKILPKSYREGYINDINNCSKNITDNLWHIELKDQEIL